MYADFDGVLAPPEAGTKPEEELHELVASMAERDPAELMRDVYHSERHLLCPDCRDRYLANPRNLPLAGGAYLRFLPGPLFRWGWSRLDAAGEPAVLYLHPWEIDPDQPRPPVGWRVRVNHYHNLGRTEARLQRLLERIRFAPMGEVLEALEAEGRLPSHPVPSDPAPRGGSSRKLFAIPDV